MKKIKISQKTQSYIVFFGIIITLFIIQHLIENLKH